MPKPSPASALNSPNFMADNHANNQRAIIMNPYRSFTRFLALSVVVVGSSVGGSAAVAQDAEAAVNQVLDALHEAASEADFDRYFALYADDAVFLGTDSTERWTIDEFKAYTRPRFANGGGWTYKPTQRHVSFTPDGHTAWFDELLFNASYGTCRGSGVLIQTDDGWKVSQYNLSIPIPNDLARSVVRSIRDSAGIGDM